MSILDHFRKQPEPAELSEQRALEILKARGYWQPNPGTKAVLNPRLYFPYADALAFAVEADRNIPDDRKAIHVIHSEDDCELYSDSKTMERGIAAGYCSQRLKGRRFVVVRRK